jgi:pyrimidine deaminase RibD-like protein
LKTVKNRAKNLSFSNHAEQCVLQNIDSIHRSRAKLKIVVIRIDAENNLTQSKPCNECIEYMKSKNIKKVTYSNEDGILITQSLTVITQTHITSGFRRIIRHINLINGKVS